MGTRSLTFVYDDNEPLLNMYRQFDGYPEGHGIDLANFLCGIDEVTNGIMVGETRRTANGMGCLAAQMIATFKKSVGGFYIYPVSSTDCGQDYEYHVYENEVVVKGYDKTIYRGTWKDFQRWCQNGGSDVILDFTEDANRDALKEKLRAGVVTVEFTKKDGTNRIMECTLAADKIGESVGGGTRTPNPDALAVYDVENNGWRSFRWDSITNVV